MSTQTRIDKLEDISNVLEVCIWNIENNSPKEIILRQANTAFSDLKQLLLDEKGEL